MLLGVVNMGNVEHTNPSHNTPVRSCGESYMPTDRGHLTDGDTEDSHRLEASALAFVAR